MGLRILAALALGALTATAAHAQAGTDNLDERQRLGRMLMVQNCGICHLKATRDAKTYGPALHRGSLSGSDEAMRAIIQAGTERMPSFQYQLKPAEIDAIVAWVRSVPAPPTTAASNSQGAR